MQELKLCSRYRLHDHDIVDSRLTKHVQYRDSANDIVNTPILTVISPLTLQQYPDQPESGATYSVEWGGGLVLQFILYLVRL
jgi:hypothetical protein